MARIEGSTAINHIADAFGVSVTLTTEYQALTARRRALIDLEADSAAPNLAATLADTDPDEWSKALTAAAKAEQRNSVIRSALDEARNLIEHRTNKHLKSAELTDHVLDQLPISDTAGRFEDAVRVLGDLADNADKAIDAGLGDQLTAYRRTGTALLSLAALPALGLLKYTEPALFRDVIDLEPLQRRQLEYGWEKLYTDDERREHDRLFTERQGVKGIEYLRDLAARGELSPAEDLAEIQRRHRSIALAGQTVAVA